MKILCFGDSNTYGYDPCSCFGGRYPAEHRWVDLLATKLGCEAVNAGENGREIPRREGELARFERLLRQPVDLLMVMLGTNDLLQGNDPDAVTRRMEGFLKGISLDRSKILLIAPPPMKPGAWVPTQALADASEELRHGYRALAERMGIRFVDAGAWGISLTFDGVHLTEAGHETFAECLFREIGE